ncbi:DinB family protein [Flammeovirgaceae bacterium SG7u.111]|nr:DinB family protein [Flammeovirgaceae bacterium SG7u.132]WPO34507.1 DinB family protein [Flammeovirgaceae bacterium SG7u.111]
MKSPTLVSEFVEQSIFRLKENLGKIEKCVAELSEEEIWKRPNESSNSVGNLIVHLCGNVTQYIISSLGEKEDLRERNKEFEAKGGWSKAELLAKLSTTVREASEVISTMDEETLLKMRSVQGYEFSSLGNILHVVEHFSYHSGQIAFWVKLLKDKDLGFYAGLDLNAKNKVG